MDKNTRNTRIAIISKTLTENPNRIFTLSYFAELFNASKSTISEDILIVRESLEKFGEGRVETLAGASGGVIFFVSVPEKIRTDFRSELLG